MIRGGGGGRVSVLRINRPVITSCVIRVYSNEQPQCAAGSPNVIRQKIGTRTAIVDFSTQGKKLTPPTPHQPGPSAPLYITSTYWVA